MESFIFSTAVALGIGLLIGMERERAKGVEPEREIAGVRTFALASLLGAFAALLDSPIVLAVFALLIGAIAIAGYLHTRAVDPGVTSEIALLAAFALGAISLTHPAYSAGAAVAITVLLASRPWLHDLVTSRMSDSELHDGLLLAAAALVVLPLLPDRTIDPWDTFNPRRLWVVVVLVMTINAIGYVGLRLFGPGKGLMLAGVLGGLVSSAATHGAMGQRASSHPRIVGAAAAAATFSSVTTAVSLLVVVSAVDLRLSIRLAPALIAAALINAGYAWWLNQRLDPGEDAQMPLGRAVSLRSGLIFGAVVSGVLIVSALLTNVFGPGAALASVAAAGFADAHSGAISAAILGRNEVLSMHMAQIAILLSFTTNAATKIIVSAATGPRSYLWRIAVGVVGSVCAAWAVWLLTGNG